MEMGSSLVGTVHRGPAPWDTDASPSEPVLLAGGVDFEADAPPAPVEVRQPSKHWLNTNRRRMWWTGEAALPYVVSGLKWLKGLQTSWFGPARWLGRVCSGLTLITSDLHCVVTHGDGTATDYGIVARHVVTTAGKNYIAACFPNTNEPENFKYHAYGTGTTAAAVGDTALQIEFTTQYNPDNTRPTGSQSSSTNVYTTAATFTPDSGGTLAVTEHGILTQAATGGGTLLDRNVFAAINLVAAVSNGDSLTTTYTLTVN
jgi:hypothetical protein